MPLPLLLCCTSSPLPSLFLSRSSHTSLFNFIRDIFRPLSEKADRASRAAWTSVRGPCLRWDAKNGEDVDQFKKQEERRIEHVRVLEECREIQIDRQTKRRENEEEGDWMKFNKWRVWVRRTFSAVSLSIEVERGVWSYQVKHSQSLKLPLCSPFHSILYYSAP